MDELKWWKFWKSRWVTWRLRHLHVSHKWAKQVLLCRVQSSLSDTCLTPCILKTSFSASHKTETICIPSRKQFRSEYDFTRQNQWKGLFLKTKESWLEEGTFAYSIDFSWMFIFGGLKFVAQPSIRHGSQQQPVAFFCFLYNPHMHI